MPKFACRSSDAALHRMFFYCVSLIAVPGSLKRCGIAKKYYHLPDFRTVSVDAIGVFWMVLLSPTWSKFKKRISLCGMVFELNTLA